MSGFVYCVSFTDGNVKIGSTKNLATRLRQVQGGTLYPPRIIDSVWYSEQAEYRRVEDAIHNCIPPRKRIHAMPYKREWYRMTFEEAMKFVKNVCHDADYTIVTGRKAVVKQWPNLLTQYEVVEGLVRLVASEEL